jgi:hypothetical protein
VGLRRSCDVPRLPLAMIAPTDADGRGHRRRRGAVIGRRRASPATIRTHERARRCEPAASARGHAYTPTARRARHRLALRTDKIHSIVLMQLEVMKS